MLGSEGPEGAGFTEAFDELAARSFRMALRLVGDPHEAEDVAAEALARALVAWPRIGSRPWREGWVLRVTANLAVDVLRKRRPNGLMPEAAPPALDVDEHLSVRAAVRRLPRRQREVLVLRYFADLHDDDIAEALQISVGSVKKHAARGLAAVRRGLAADTKELSLAW